MNKVILGVVTGILFLGVSANASAETWCVTEIISTPEDSDYQLQLCEQDELWDEIDSIWKYLETNVGISNTDTNSSDLADLIMQNRELNRKVSLLENQITELQETVNRLDSSSSSKCWLFC